MTTTAPEQGLKALRRRRMLEPYMLRLQEIQAREKRKGPLGSVGEPMTLEDVAVTIDGVEVPLDAISVYDSDSRVGDLMDRSDSELALQSVALLLKSDVDAARLRSEVARNSDLYALQAELMLNSAMGTALLRELHNRIDELVKSGAMQSARKLSKVKHRLGALVRDLKRSIDESNRERADRIASQLTEHVEEPTAILETEGGIPETGAEITDGKRPSRRKRDRRAREERAAKGMRPARANLRTRILLALVGIGLVVCMLSTILPQLTSHVQRELSRADFISSAPIVEILARPPSLYATLDAKAWAGYDDTQKRQLVDDMGSVLITNGYWGLLLHTPDGRPVAQWLVKGGSRLLESERTSETPHLPRAQSFDRFVP